MDYLRSDDAFTYQNQEPGSPLKKRDGLITLLAVLHVISGCWRLYQENRIVGMYVHYSLHPDSNVRLMGPPLPLLALGNLTILFILAAGVGLWLNAKWGWWLTGFVYSYAVTQAIYMIVMSFIRKDELQQLGISFDLQPYQRNLVIYSLLFCYLQTNRVLKSFGLPESAQFRWKSIAMQVGAALASLVVTTVLSLLILTTFGRSVPYIE